MNDHRIGNYVKRLKEQYPDEKKQHVLLTMVLLKADAELNGNVINMSDPNISSMMVHLIKNAADNVGLTPEECRAALQGGLAALSDDIAAMSQAAQAALGGKPVAEAVKEAAIEPPLMPSPAVIDYLNEIASKTKQ